MGLQPMLDYPALGETVLFLPLYDALYSRVKEKIQEAHGKSRHGLHV
jgi:hypothetical protein